MPRKNPVSANEPAVGARLSQARALHKISQTDAAAALGITRNQIVSYEIGKVPLPWLIGEKFCAMFGVSQLWLATGELPQWIFVPLDWKRDPSPPRASFATVIQERFSAEIRAFHRELAKQLDTTVEQLDPADSLFTSDLPWPYYGSWRGVVNTVARMATRFAEQDLPPDLHRPFIKSLLENMTDFRRRHLGEIAEHGKMLDSLVPDLSIPHKLQMLRRLRSSRR
jgi:DNA-binding XRE family transcriptional regulator